MGRMGAKDRARKLLGKQAGAWGAMAAAAALVIYGVSYALFGTSILRDDSRSLAVKGWIKKSASAIHSILGGIKLLFSKEGEKAGGDNAREQEKGLGFRDFQQEMEEGIAWFHSQEKERITLLSHDGLRLTAYYLPAKVESRRLLILMHGYRNDGFWDFAGLARFYHQEGYHLLVPHQRSHGESEGRYICFGIKERRDLGQWAEYFVQRFQGDCSVFLSGISMGGATVLMASELELPKQVKGIIADCAFTSAWDIFSHILKKDYHLPKFPFLYVADWICRRKAGFSCKECSTLSALKNTGLPILFIHGGKDTFVPTYMSLQNYEAYEGPKELLVVNEAAHGTSSLVEPEKYRRTVMEFMRRWENEG